MASLRRALTAIKIRRCTIGRYRPLSWPTMISRIDDGETAGAALAETIYIAALSAEADKTSDYWRMFTMSIRSAVTAVAVMALVAAFVQAAHADVTFKSQDGTLEITLPNGWHEAKQGGPEAKIHVAGQGTRVTIREHAKEDFKDIKAVANFLAERLKKRFTDVEPKFSDVQVNGKPAVRVELEGTEPSGVKVGYLITIVDSGKSYISIAGTGNASAFAKHKQLLSDLPNQLKVTSGARTTGRSAAGCCRPGSDSYQAQLKHWLRFSLRALRIG